MRRGPACRPLLAATSPTRVGQALPLQRSTGAEQKDEARVSRSSDRGRGRSGGSPPPRPAHSPRLRAAQGRVVYSRRNARTGRGIGRRGATRAEGRNRLGRRATGNRGGV